MTYFGDALAYQLKMIREMSSQPSGERDRDLLLEMILQSVRDLYFLRYGRESHRDIMETARELELSLDEHTSLLLDILENASRRHHKFLEVSASTDLKDIHCLIGELERVYGLCSPELSRNTR
ncbi:MAG: hypothetical protein HPY53_14870 [Brevinematales bacterium]|nr:hypothetical protein [Brevinematales bacterium]